MRTDDDTPAGDLLHGATEIATYIGTPVRRTCYLLERGMIPAGKLGSLWVASKSKLREHYSRIAGGAA